MLRSAAAVAAVILAGSPALACTFCGGDLRSRQTLRMQYAAAKAVLYGQLKNPRVDPKTDAGSTEFHATAAFKDDPARGGKTLIVIPQYLPVIGNTPPEYLLFCDVANDDPTYHNGDAKMNCQIYSDMARREDQKNDQRHRKEKSKRLLQTVSRVSVALPAG